MRLIDPMNFVSQFYTFYLKQIAEINNVILYISIDMLEFVEKMFC